MEEVEGPFESLSGGRRSFTSSFSVRSSPRFAGRQQSYPSLHQQQIHLLHPLPRSLIHGRLSAPTRRLRNRSENLDPRFPSTSPSSPSSQPSNPRLSVANPPPPSSHPKHRLPRSYLETLAISSLGEEGRGGREGDGRGDCWGGEGDQEGNGACGLREWKDGKDRDSWLGWLGCEKDGRSAVISVVFFCRVVLLSLSLPPSLFSSHHFYTLYSSSLTLSLSTIFSPNIVFG